MVELGPYRKIKLEYFLIFKLLVEHRSFSKVAVILGKTQGTISQLLKDFEHALGDILLIKRTSKVFEVTPEGQIVYKIGLDILNSFDEMKRELETLTQIENPTIKIASSSIPGECILPPVYSKYCERFPNVQFKITISNSSSALEKLLKKDVVFAAVGKLPQHTKEKLEIIPIGEDSIQVLAREHHPIFKHFQRFSKTGNKDSLSKKLIDLLVSFPWIFREKGSATRDTFLEKFPAADRIRIALELQNNLAIINTLEYSDALTALSSLVSKGVCAENHVALVFPEYLPEIKRKFYFLKLEKSKLTKHEQSFWDFLQDYFSL